MVQVCGVAWVYQMQYCTHTCATCSVGTVGLPVPMRNPTHDHPLPLAPTLAPAPKTESTELSILIDTMKQFVATLDSQSKPSTLTSSLLVSTPHALPVLTFQLSPREQIEEIEKELSALRSQVCPCEQATLKPPATPKPFISTPISIPVPMPAPKGRRTLVPTPEFDDTP